MGLLRTLLAMAVLLQHAGSLFGLTMTGTVVSVETFFIVSGFYMALILSEKYVGHGAYSLFISNRFLKIFPVYWVVLAMTAVASLLFAASRGNAWMAQPLLDHAGSMSPGALAFLLATNIAIFGQDVVMFLGLGPGGGFFLTSNFRNTNPQLFNFLLVPQAWTLALELMFYLLAPFLVRRSTITLLGLGVASLAVRIVNYRVLGFNDDPWTYRFFPSELMFFVAGILSYRLYVRVRGRDFRRMPGIWLGAVLAATASFQFLPGGSLKWACYFGLVTLGLPFAFLATRNNKLDRQLGEMSYPIYISHIFVIGVVAEFVNRNTNPNLFSSISVAATFVFSYLLLRYVGLPLEAVRQRRARVRRQPAVGSPGATLVNTAV